ncbi:MAG: S1 family peptidase [Archangiaceae bacterium]|nr:S1 family peptidase [Archangiaceae bacterium]
MRHSPRSLVAAACSALALLGCGVPQDPDFIAPDPSQQELRTSAADDLVTDSLPVSLRRQRPGLDTGRQPKTASAQYLVDTFQLSPEEADLRIAMQEQLNGLRGELLEVLGENFGGMWVDQANGGAVHVAFRGDRTADAKGTAARFVGSATVILDPVNYSLGELDATLEELSRRLQTPGWFQASVTAVQTDEPKNRVLVSVDPDGQRDGARSLVEVAKSLRHEFGALVEVIEGPRSELTACSSQSACGSPLRGGIRLTSASFLLQDLYGGWHSVSSTCTAGFTARSTDGTGWLLTAGHCSPMNVSWIHGQQGIGPVRQITTYDGTYGVDVERIRIDNRYWATGGWVYPGRKVKNVLGPSAVTPWTVLCKMGVSTGYGCGLAVSNNKTVTACDPRRYYIPGDPNNARCPLITLRVLEFSTRSASGDSGAPVYQEINGTYIYAAGTASGALSTHTTAARLGDIYASMPVRLELLP